MDFSSLTPPTMTTESTTVRKTFYSSHAAFVDTFGGVCTILSCGIAGYMIMQHLRYYHQPAIQLQIIRILAMIPVSLTHSVGPLFKSFFDAVPNEKVLF